MSEGKVEQRRKRICDCGHVAASHGPNWHGESPEKEPTGFPVCHYPGCTCMNYFSRNPVGEHIAAHAPSPSEEYERGVRDAAELVKPQCFSQDCSFHKQAWVPYNAILALLQSNPYRGKEPTK